VVRGAVRVGDKPILAVVHLADGFKTFRRRDDVNLRTVHNNQDSRFESVPWAR